MIMSSTPSRTRRVGMRGDLKKNSAFQLTHAFAANYISQPTKEKLTDECSNWGGDLYTKILVFVKLLTCGMIGGVARE